MKRGLAPWLIIAMVCVAGGVGYWGVRVMVEPLATPTGHNLTRTIDIPEGTTLRQVATLLENERLIASRWGFLLLGKLTWADRRILAGEYALHAGMRPTEILSEIVNGRVVHYPVTVPEGYTAAQIADLLGEKGLADPAEFLRLVHDRDFIRTLTLDVAHLEGYLFPDTYQFARRMKTTDIIGAMVSNLWQAVTPELRARASELNMSLHQVLTLASVIEKETSVEAERDIISGVFHNRLRRRIPLQSDPTVIYGLSKFDGNLRKRDLSVASPYNTYRVVGLPPGPIASPGAGSIRAALYPVPSTYLYFVSRNDGTHQFSSTLAEHNRAVDKYQRRPARRLS
ncbi:MAG: endolytic transglycosylase MltG [Nitrospirae bacterium]|nr:endolytic transglycosylase MltG [Nitrospirota bacterium]